ncbi:copper(I)-binding protein [Kribbella orskensis]|uniref:Copper(I)-binding protein n=1 Tax=Kribbella orskensis TaxID=2512216 RepID=A0ABY2BM94_9ACTN|nr:MULTISPECIES: copper chaperone PCu(A)C [Kribbella]TCN41646.1 copper(I)-binding protein [Kribbella sp. VKM Ac-2500]TCO25524.1 copper(I)-binding protein [Kribbella orskensis]
MRMPARKTIRSVQVLLTLGLLAGCGSQDPFQNLPAGGTDAGTGQIVIDDIWANGPQGLAAGSDAPLQLTMTNESATTDDALVGVSTTVSDQVTLEQDGHAVSSIAIPAGSQVDLERRTGIELQGLRRALTPGQWFSVTFTFQRAAPVTVLAAAGPLAASR